MKIDGEPMFCHSTLSHKLDSKPFQHNDNTLHTDGAKEHNEVLKENQNGILCDRKGCEKGADQLPSEMNDEDGLWDEAILDCSMSVDDLTKGNEGEVRDSVAQYTISSSKVDLLEETYFYTDKSVMECDLPELIVCYKESSYHVVKDICIDEGVPSLENFLVESGKDEHMSLSTFLPPDGDKNNDLIKEKVDIELPVPDGMKSSAENACNKDAVNQCEPEDLIQKGEVKNDATDKSSTDVSKEKIVPENMLLVQESCMNYSLLESSKFDGDEVEQQSVQISSEKAILASPAPVSAAEESNDSSLVNELAYNSKVESGSITFDFDSSTAEASGREEASPNGDSEQPLETPNMSRHEEGISDNLTVSSQVQHGLGESSFSKVGPLSGLITYSGPIAYSGSLSLRSDSSTTSTRSFAFPILQSEWNSSPVRMAKADRRNFRKHRGWRQGLLCCRF
ncbi:hypothetical protein L1049_006050 [Liquidambar formosana]|uniref:18S pre-ribosomal assembly protein gar2-related n=1 Tax=Liquidambar formosana TaxID=63359 RepID=A0AAP0REU7_LIQFO